VRSRFVRSTLIVVLSSITVLSLILLWINQRAIEDEYQRRVHAEAERLAEQFDSIHDNTLVQKRLDAWAQPERAVTVTTLDGRRLSDGVIVSDPAFSSKAETTDGRSVGVVWSGSEARAGEVWSALLILGIGALTAAVAVAVTWRQSGRVVAPLASLADTASRLGSGDARPADVRYGVAELDAVAAALDASAARINQLVSQERELTVDVSHQLRTPLTALSMRLDEVLVAEDLEAARAEAVAAQEQVARLTGVVVSLLGDGDHDAEGDDAVSLDAVVDQQVREWTPAFEAAGRALDVIGVEGLTVHGSPGGVAQVLATLLENSLAHGAGTTTITRRRAAGALVLEVCDEGPGVPAGLAGQVFERSVSGTGGTGVGLALAQSTAHEFGGQLQLLDARSARFALFLSEA
jgi:signal transduction histidine kinase